MVSYFRRLNEDVFNIWHGYLGVAYPIHGKSRQYWLDNFCDLGAPVTNEYYWPEGTENYIVQWFEPSENNYIGIAYNTLTGTYDFAANLGIPQDEHFDQDLALNCGYSEVGYGMGGGGGTQIQNIDVALIMIPGSMSWNDPQDLRKKPQRFLLIPHKIKIKFLSLILIYSKLFWFPTH